MPQGGLNLGSKHLSLLPLSHHSWFVNWTFFYPPSSGIASCVGTAGTMTWRLHLTRPCCVAIEWVLIWVVSPDWVEEQYCKRHMSPGTLLFEWRLLSDQYRNPERGFEPGTQGILSTGIWDRALDNSATTAGRKLNLFWRNFLKEFRH